MAAEQGDSEFRQKNVDSIIHKIANNLSGSIDSSEWQRKYSLVSANIEDLRKTLAYGGKITSNPVKKHERVLADMLAERKIDFSAFCDAQERLDKSRRIAAKKAIYNVGMEMISRITPVPGKLSPLTQARTKNAQIIKEEFARLKTIDKAIAYLEGLKKSILPSIREIRDRKHAMVPLIAQFDSLTSGFDGVYKGSFKGGASGTISFTVRGTQVTGSLSGSYKGDVIKGRFSGIVDRFGYMSTTLTGTLTDSSSMKLGSFAFKGSISGNLIGPSGKGKWSARNAWAAPTGNWTAVRK